MSVSKKENDLIGKRIEKARKMNNMTQDEVAKYLGMKRANYTSTEIRNESRYLKDYQILELAKLFNVSSDYLLGLISASSPDLEVKEISKKLNLFDDSINKLQLLNYEATISFNNFINTKHVMPYIFNEIYTYQKLKKAFKVLIKIYKITEIEELIKYYIKNNNIKQLKKIFKYFDELFIELNECDKYYYEGDYKLIKLKAFPEYKNELSEEDIIFLEHVECNYLEMQSNGKQLIDEQDLNISLIFQNMKEIFKSIVNSLHKEVAYSKYMVISVFQDYISRIEGFTYEEELENNPNDNSMESFLNDQDKYLKRGENNEHKGKNKK